MTDKTYTAERVEAQATWEDTNSGNRLTGHMLRAYAATLRQQARAVDEACPESAAHKVVSEFFRFIDLFLAGSKQSKSNPNACFVDWRDVCALRGDMPYVRSALQAALARPATVNGGLIAAAKACADRLQHLCDTRLRGKECAEARAEYQQLREALARPASSDRAAYEGAREDLLDWKGRALRAESRLRGLGYQGIDASEAPASSDPASGEAVGYFSADPAEGEFNTHRTLADAIAGAERLLDSAKDDASDYGWQDETPQICYGVVLGKCVELEGSRRPAPEGSEYTEFVDYRLTDTHPAEPVEVPEVRVTTQGVAFGRHCWYSHERITGLTADELNSGKGNVTARAYMEWVQSNLAAAPGADGEVDRG